ncbi:MAG: hypothetical protein AB1401_15140 [Thermodesulfobacteriota bacterium]
MIDFLNNQKKGGDKKKGGAGKLPLAERQLIKLTRERRVYDYV